VESTTLTLDSCTRQVVARLKELENQQFANGAEVRFRDADYNLLSFEEQIKMDLETDIMVGPHGAGKRIQPNFSERT
jgi:hypothetical protein